MDVAHVAAVLERLAAVYPWSVDSSDDLDRALGYLAIELDGETVVEAGYVATVLVTCCFLPVFVLASESMTLGAIGAGILGLGVAHGIHRAPVLIAVARRTRALGALPGLIGRAALRIRIEPTAELAAAFTAHTGDGPLADSLEDHVRRASGTPRTGLGAFADEWSEWFPAVERATALLEASAAARPGERDRSLERATEAVRNGARDEMADFSDEVRGPATGVYAFGVLLPLALVGILPAASVAGVDVSTSVLIALYNLVLPAILLFALGWLLARRPVAFPPPKVDRSHPDVPDRAWPSLVGGLACGGAAWLGSTLLLPAWTGPIAAAGAGLGVALIVRYRPVEDVRNRVRRVEQNLDDALYLIGRRVTDGEAVETALATASERTPGPTGEMLADAVGTGRRLRLGVRESFLGEHGALATLPSPRARGAAALLALAASEGRPAGGAIVATAEHLAELRRIEREARRDLKQVTETLANTGALFGPLVAGATVALAEGMDGAGTDSTGAVGSGVAGAEATAEALSTSTLGTSIGVYVLFLAALLTALSVGLDRGLDRALVGYRIGIAWLAATATFLTAYGGARLLL